MKNYILSSAWTLIIALTSFTLSGCNKDSDEQPQKENEYSEFNDDQQEDDGQQENTISYTVCTKWGAEKSKVMDYMKDLEMNTMEKGFICYNGKENIKTISYQFQEEKLQASLAIYAKENSSLEELRKSLGGYVYIGEKNGIDIYISETDNTIATIGQKTNSDKTYYTIGYTELHSETEPTNME